MQLLISRSNNTRIDKYIRAKRQSKGIYSKDEGKMKEINLDTCSLSKVYLIVYLISNRYVVWNN